METEDLKIILDHIDNQPKSLFFVLGDKINEEVDNIFAVHTQLIPNVNEIVVFQSKRHLIVNKIIDYTQVESHSLDSEDRGKESIYIFLKLIA